MKKKKIVLIKSINAILSASGRMAPIVTENIKTDQKEFKEDFSMIRTFSTELTPEGYKFPLLDLYQAIADRCRVAVAKNLFRALSIQASDTSIIIPQKHCEDVTDLALLLN